MFKEQEEEEEEPVEIKEEPVQNEEFNEDEIPMQTLELQCVCLINKKMNLLANKSGTKIVFTCSIHSENGKRFHI